MTKDKAKKIASWGLGIPAAIVACSEAQTMDGVALQLGALALLCVVLFANGVFIREETHGK